MQQHELEKCVLDALNLPNPRYYTNIELTLGWSYLPTLRYERYASSENGLQRQDGELIQETGQLVFINGEWRDAE